ncbi:MAG TPA: four helix bundle protein [Thermoanaerobaculia bacterium]|nr:four helix bundle protein [Thermoanaerobaculia bacterium]
MRDGDGRTRTDLVARTRSFAVRVMRLGDSLPRSRSANVIAYQLIRSGSSVGAHYREAMRSRSNAELITKFEGALMELEETAYWLELLVELEIVTAAKLAPLRDEAGELTAMFVATVRNLKAKR